MNINPFETNNIYTNKKPKTMRGNQSYGLSFGANENGGYDSYQLSAPKKEESFWEKWKNVIIAGTVAVGAVVLGAVGYNKGWFGKIKKWFGKTETKAVKEAPKVSEKGTEVVQDEISKHLETLKLGNLGIGDKTLTDLLKPNNQTVTKAQFVAVAQEIKRKGNLTDNIVKQAAVAVLERLRKNLNANSLNRDKKINGFDTTQEIKDVGVLDEIIKESSSVPQSQSEVPENETHNESETENDDQPVVPENPVSKDVKNSENDDDSLFEVTDETPEVEESVETEEVHSDEMEDEKIKKINEKFVKLNKKIEDGEEDMTIDDVKEVENILTLCRKNRLDLDRSGRTFLGSVLYKAVAQNKPDINAILDIFQQYTEFDENNVSAIFCVLRAASKQKIYNSINDVISFINNCKLDNDSKIILLSFIVSDAHDNKEIWNIQDETELKQIASNFIINFAQKDESIIRKSIGCISDLLVEFIKLALLDQSSYKAVNKIYELEKDSRNYIEKTLTEESKKEVLSEINPRIAAMENWLQNNKPSVPPVVPVIPAEQPVVPSVPPVVPAQPVQLVKPVQSVEPAKSDNGEPPVAPAEPVVLVVSETKPSVVPKTTTSAVSEAATGFVQPKDPDTTRNIMYLKAFLEKVKRLEELYKSLNDLSSWMSNLISKDKEKSELVRSQFTSCFQSASNETNLIENLKNLQNNNTICKDLPNDFENLLKNLIKNLQVSFQNATNKKALLEQLKTLFQDVSSSSRSQGSLFPFSFNIRNLNPAFTPTCEMFNNYLKECINKGKGTEPDIDILTMIKEFCFTKNNEILPWSNSTLVSFLKMYNKLDAICVPEFTNEELKAIADMVKKDPIYSPIYIGFINILSLLAKKESGRKQEFLEIANSLKSNEPEPGEIIAIYFEDEENIKNKLKELQAPLEDKTSVEPDEIKPSGTYTEGVGVASILDVINKLYQKNPQMIQVVFDTCFVNEAFTQDNAKPVANVLTAAIKYEVFKEDLATLKDYISKFMNDCQNNNQEAVANVLTAAIKYEVFKEDLTTLKDYISKFMNDCQNNNQEAVANVLTAAIKYEVFKEDLTTLKDYISKFMNNCQNNNQEAVANVLTAAIEKDIFQDDSEREKLKGDIDQFMNACQGNNQEAVANVLTAAIESDKFDKAWLQEHISKFLNVCLNDNQNAVVYVLKAVANVLTAAIESDKFDEDWLHDRISELMNTCQNKDDQEAVANVLTAAIESDKFDEDWLHDRISELMNTCQNKDDQEAVVYVLKAVANVLTAAIESDKFDEDWLQEHISKFLNVCLNDNQNAFSCVLKAVADVLEATIESDKFDDKAWLKEHISNFLNACSEYNDDYIQIYKTVYNAAKGIFTEEERAGYENEIKFYEEKNKACPFGIVPSSNDPVPFDPEKLGIIDGNEELCKENEKRKQEIKKLFESGKPFGKKKVSEIKTADDFIDNFAKDKKGEFIDMLDAMNIRDEISFTRQKWSSKKLSNIEKTFTISKVDFNTFDIKIKMGSNDIIEENISSFRIYTQWDDDNVLQLASEEPQYDDETDDETDDEYHADFELFKM